ncbi:MAG: HNH endonuclease [Defluviitaleaceae bacterium]|nr:HNH endonuclease [Defluviitaleaceae bacterium]
MSDRFELIKYNRNTSSEEMLRDLKSVALKLNKETITMDEYKVHSKYHPSTLTRKIGSWFLCLERAGLQVSRSPLNIPNEELFQNLENIWRHFGRQPKYHEIIKPLSRFSVGTYEKRFGTYYNALTAFVEHMDGEIIESSALNKPQTNPRTINYRMRFMVMKRDNFKCKICGCSPASSPEVELHIDHIVPCAKGGTALYENLQTLCSVCNLGKSDLNM